MGKVFISPPARISHGRVNGEKLKRWKDFEKMTVILKKHLPIFLQANPPTSKILLNIRALPTDSISI